VKPANQAAANFLASAEPVQQQTAPAAAAPAGSEMPPGFDAGTWAVLDADQRAKVRAALGLS
jgi:hypothetical protein